MTGFARSDSEGDPSVEITIRSVNHRFLDMRIRSPAELEPADAMVRRAVKEKVRRGNLQITVSLRSTSESSLQLNRPLADAYFAAYKELAAIHGVLEPPDLTAILRIPGVLAEQSAERTEAERQELLSALETTLGRALDALNREREREGAGMASEIRERTQKIAAETETVEKAVAGLGSLFRERLESRLGELLDQTAVEPQRILQEAAILADRADVSEEIQRLRAHCGRLLELLEQDGERGKQVDFLAQELNREANTLLSKTNSLGSAALPITDAGLRLKAEIEKIRELAQNLE